MAIAVGTLDPNVYDKYKSFGDIQMAQANNNLVQQTAQIDLDTKKNIYSTQIMSAAAASGDPATIAAAKNHLANFNIDPSQWSDDPAKLQLQAAAARQSLLNPYQTATLGQAVIGNDLKATEVGGPAKAYIQPVPGNLSAQPAAQVANTPASAVQTPSTIEPPQNVADNPDNTVNMPQKAPPIDGAASAVNISSAPTTGVPIQMAANFGQQPAAQVANSPIIPSQRSDETNAQYNSRISATQKAQEMDPAYIQQKATAETTGKGIGDATVKAGTATALSDRIMQGLDAMDQINESGKLPYSGNIIGPETQAAISNRFGKNSIANAVGINQDAADSSQAFTKINKQQVVVGLQDMLAAAPAGSRLNRQLLGLIDQANGIDTNASQESIRNQIGILRNEMQNVGISENNTVQNLKGGTQQPYNAIPISTPAPQGTQAPEGIVITNGKQTLIKKNGQWVIQ